MNGATSTKIINGGNIPDTNLNWTLDNSGTLTISGKGDMLHSKWNTNNAWQDKSDLIQRIVIEKGVASIGDLAFAGNNFNGCPNLKEVTIFDSVKKIGVRAFQYCGSLKKISLPDSIEEIGKHSFFYCSSLEEINLPVNLVHIGERAFKGCHYLESINFSRAQNLKQIDDEAFSSCQWLKEVIIMSSTKKIGRNVFAECGRLEVIKYPRNLPDAYKLSEGNNAKLIPY